MFQEDAALKLLDGIVDLYVARGKKVTHFNLKKDRPDQETLTSHLLGRSGTLRAPTFRKGKTLIVGFNAELYDSVFN